MNPSNYRPISLLPVLLFFLTSLKKWMKECNIVQQEQFGFWKGYKCIPYCLILLTLNKYIKTNRWSIFAAFVDPQTAFDLVSHTHLWEKLNSTSTPK